MGDTSPPSPVLLLLAAFSRHAEALEWAREHATRHWGPVALASEVFDFAETDYYVPSMGPDLKKVFLVFQQLVDPGRLAALKTLTNAWESEYAAGGRHAEPRPLNLDPGYLTEAKLVLASTKDHAHRIYLAEGIFAEVTLSYRDRRWQPQAWTFADYRRADYQAFFSRCRDYLRACRRAGLEGGV
jgi:hypothetical protein